MKLPCLCLDVDGTVRRSKSGQTFITGPDDIELLPGIAGKIVQYRGLGYYVIFVSNQGGIGHGYKTNVQNEQEMAMTLLKLKQATMIEGLVNAVYSCPAMEDAKQEVYRYRSLLRKPQIGMLVKAEIEAQGRGVTIDWSRSLMVGDRPEDEGLAKNAGIAFEHIDNFLAKP